MINSNISEPLTAIQLLISILRLMTSQVWFMMELQSNLYIMTTRGYRQVVFQNNFGKMCFKKSLYYIHV